MVQWLKYKNVREYRSWLVNKVSNKDVLDEKNNKSEENFMELIINRKGDIQEYRKI